MNRREALTTIGGTVTGISSAAGLAKASAAMKKRERLRIYRMDCRQLVEIFEMSRRPTKYIVQCPTLPALPDDYEIEGVHYDFAGRCFEVLVSSNSFDPVPCGQIPPDHHDRLTAEYKVYRIVEA